MQTAEKILIEPLALPPPQDGVPAKKLKVARLLPTVARLICCAIALFVLSLCAFQKLEAALENGVVNFITNELLCINGTENLGDIVSAVAFGDTETETYKTKPAVSLPKIFYVPKEEIVRRIDEEKQETEIKFEELYAYDLSGMPNDCYPIIPVDLSTKELSELKNDTSYSIDMKKIEEMANMPFYEEISNEPLVLIVHTHGTESFSNNTPYYNDTFNYPRSENVSENVVAVGKIICDELNKSGIPTIHCETMHDKESYISAYDRSAESIRRYLEKYPSIKYVFDVHRDSLIRSDLTKLRPVTLHDGKPCAQIMIIAGSDEKGAGEYNWHGNLSLAVAINQRMSEAANGIVRTLYLRGASYNQQYAEHGLLLEIGSCGNTLSEAKEAAKVFAKAFAKVIKAE